MQQIVEVEVIGQFKGDALVLARTSKHAESEKQLDLDMASNGPETEALSLFRSRRHEMRIIGGNGRTPSRTTRVHGTDDGSQLVRVKTINSG